MSDTKPVCEPVKVPTHHLNPGSTTKKSLSRIEELEVGLVKLRALLSYDMFDDVREAVMLNDHAMQLIDNLLNSPKESSDGTDTQ